MLRSLFLTFARIGSFTFGGGYAMLAIIEEDVVNKKKWLTTDEFIDLFAVAQSLPGVFAVNLSIFIGHKLAGKKGAIVATLGTIMPSFLAILLLAFCFEGIKEMPQIASIMKGIRPTVIALIVVPIYTTWHHMKLSIGWVVVPILSAFLVWFLFVSPILIILAAAALGILYREGIAPYVKRLPRSNL